MAVLRGKLVVVLASCVACTDLGGLSSGGSSSGGADASSSPSDASSEPGADGGVDAAREASASTPGVSCGGKACLAPATCCNGGSGALCSPQGCPGVPAIECDEPGDCRPGQQCCAQLDLSTGQPLLATACTPSCSTPVCVVQEDCAAASTCKPLAIAFGPKLNACQ